MKAWLRTVIAYAIPVLILAGSIYIMIAEPGVTKRAEGDQFIQHIKQLQVQIDEGRWDQAAIEIKQLQAEFADIIPRIQFSVEREEMNEISIALAQLEAYILCHDRNEAIASLFTARQHWDDLDH